MIKGLKVLLAGLLVAGFCAHADAAATMSIYDGVNPLLVIADDGPGDSILSPGIVFVQTNVGVWFLSISSAVTKPVFGSGTDPIMDLIITASSSAGGSLTFKFSDSGFGPATGMLNATSQGILIDGSPATLTYNVFGDPANVVGATTIPIASTGTSGMPAYSTSSGLLPLGAPYSLTQVLTIQSAGPTSVSVDGSFNVTPVPEPGLLAFACLGLVSLVFRGFRSSRA